jgi:hypothetical protein
MSESQWRLEDEKPVPVDPRLSLAEILAARSGMVLGLKVFKK